MRHSDFAPNAAAAAAVDVDVVVVTLTALLLRWIAPADQGGGWEGSFVRRRNLFAFSLPSLRQGSWRDRGQGVKAATGK